MTQKAHVPKFGNWDGENIPYTTYFKNIHREKVSGSKIFNPNDPEKSPDTFVPEYKKQEETDKKYHGRIYSSEDSGLQGHMGTPVHPSSYQRAPHSQKGVNHEDINSETANGKGSSDRPIPSPRNHQRSRKYSMDGSYSYSPSPSRQSTPQAGTTGQDQHLRVPSIPKFGDWDERDPKSAEAFTFIFNKVKEEKKMSAAGFPSIHTEPLTNPVKQLTYQAKPRNGRYASSRSKILCCIYPDSNN